MMFKKEYAIAVIQNGKIVPEKDGEVTLPYGSEYQVRLKNKSRQRSVADVYIDGNIACKGIVVDEDGTVDIERYIRPNIDSFTNGARFKLARLSHPGVADSNDDQNGLLEVRFYKELPKRPQPTVIEISTTPPWSPTPFYYYKSTITSTDGRDPGVFTSMSDFLSVKNGHKIGEVHSNSVVSDYMMCDRGPSLSSNNVKGIESILRSKMADGPAATVQGSLSNQRVENVYLEVDTSTFESLVIKLRGVTKVTRHDKCPSCGHKRRSAEKFCPKCGEALVIEG